MASMVKLRRMERRDALKAAVSTAKMRVARERVAFMSAMREYARPDEVVEDGEKLHQSAMDAFAVLKVARVALSAADMALDEFINGADDEPCDGRR